MFNTLNKNQVTKPFSYIQFLLESRYLNMDENIRLILYYLSQENFDKIFEKMMFKSELHNNLYDKLASLLLELEILNLNKNLVILLSNL